MEIAMIAETEKIKLKAFAFHHPFTRYVSDIYMPEIRLPRFGTKSGELRTIECDDIFIFRMFILKSL